MCTVLLPPGDNPIAVNKYILSYLIISNGARHLRTPDLLEQLCAVRPLRVKGNFQVRYVRGKSASAGPQRSSR